MNFSNKHLKKFVNRSSNLLLNEINVKNYDIQISNFMDVISIFINLNIHDHIISDKSTLCLYRTIDGIFNYNVKYIFCKVIFDDDNKISYISTLFTFYCNCYYDNILQKRTFSGFENFVFLNILYKYLKNTFKPFKLIFSSKFYCDNNKLLSSSIKLFNLDIAHKKICNKIYKTLTKNNYNQKIIKIQIEINSIRESLSCNGHDDIETKKNNFKKIQLELSKGFLVSTQKIKNYHNLKNELESLDKSIKQRIILEDKLIELNNELGLVNEKIRKVKLFDLC